MAAWNPNMSSLYLYLSLCHRWLHNACFQWARRVAGPKMKVTSSPQWCCSMQSWIQPRLCTREAPALHCNSTDLQIYNRLSIKESNLTLMCSWDISTDFSKTSGTTLTENCHIIWHLHSIHLLEWMQLRRIQILEDCLVADKASNQYNSDLLHSQLQICRKNRKSLRDFRHSQEIAQIDWNVLMCPFSCKAVVLNS